MKKLAYLLALPIGLGLIWGFTIKVVHAAPSSKSSAVFSTENFPAVVIPKIKKTIKKKDITSVASDPKTESTNDTLRLVGSSLGKNPKVIIDGKSYDSSILTKISPRCVSHTMILSNQITITTKNNKIEYATAIDIENVKAKKVIDHTPLYSRYAQRKQDGEEFHEIRTNQPRGGHTIYRVAKDTRVAIFIYGQMYTEAEAKELKPDLLANHNGMSFYMKGEENFKKLFPQLVDDYDAVLNILEKPKTEN